MEMRGGVETAKRFDFLIGTNFSEQAEAITRQCVRYLADEKCTRLGVICRGSGASPRLVASSLERLEIPHNDGLGHIVPGIFESAEWQAWIELQRAPRLNSFLRFLNALPDPAVLSPKISRQVFEKILHDSYNEVLLDDLELLLQAEAGIRDYKVTGVQTCALPICRCAAAGRPASPCPARRCSGRWPAARPIRVSPRPRAGAWPGADIPARCGPRAALRIPGPAGGHGAKPCCRRQPSRARLRVPAAAGPGAIGRARRAGALPAARRARRAGAHVRAGYP